MGERSACKSGLHCCVYSLLVGMSVCVQGSMSAWSFQQVIVYVIKVVFKGCIWEVRAFSANCCTLLIKGKVLTSLCTVVATTTRVKSRQVLSSSTVVQF